MRLGALLAALIRGPGSEELRGDLEESHRRRNGQYAADAFRSLLLWYSPAELRRRYLRNKPGRGSSPSPVRPEKGRWMEGWMADVRFALRGFRRRPGFVLLVLLTLGLGIGATTTIFSVVDTVVLRPLPYENAGSLVALGNTFPEREWANREEGLQHLAGVSYLNFIEVRERARGLEEVAAGEWGNVLLPDQGCGPEVANLLRVTEGFFDLLGVSPLLGRTFLPEEYGTTPEPIVILSHGAWMDRFGGDPGLVGTSVPTFGSTFTVVGVLPPTFQPPEALYPSNVEFWVPLDPGHPRYSERGRRSLTVVGRLRPGTSLDQLRAELHGVAAWLAGEFPDGNVYPDGSHFGWGANSLHAQTLGGTGRTLMIFLAASALILLIAVLNAAHLFLVRGLDRVGEISLRRAVGADSWAVTRNLLTESVILSLGGGVLGALVAVGGVKAFLQFVPSSMPRLGDVAVDVRVLAVCALVSLGVGIATGLAPALRFGRRELAETLKQGGSRSISRAGGRSRLFLVSAQLALALILTVGGTLLFESFLRVRGVDPGFDPQNLLTFSMPMKRPTTGEEAGAWVAWESLYREVEEVPGASVAMGSNLPFEDPNWAPSVFLPGDPPETRRQGIAGYVVTPGYREVLGIPLIDGRDLSSADGPDAQPVALANQAFFHEVFRGGEAVGREIFLRGDQGDVLSLRIVGIVGDVVRTRAEEPKGPALYVPYTQTEWSYNVRVAVRTHRDPADVAPELRQAASRFFSAFPVRDLATMSSRVGNTRTEPRFHAILLVSFAGVAIFLAAVGFYGTLAHMVGRRTRELGIRMALGADGGSILGLVLRQGGLAVGLGLGAGGAGAFLLTRFLDQYLFQIGSLHPPAFLWAGLVLVLLAALATVGPVRRARGVDLVESLRVE